MRAADIVIVGSGHGGAQAAINLRTRGSEGSILVVSRDQDLPYERPPLSKDYLADKKPFERLLIRPPAFWKERNVELRCGTTVRRVDPEAHTLSVSGDDEPIGYGTLIWAAGGDPRRLSCSGAQLAGVHALRDKGDTDRLRAQIAAGARRIVVVGGGYIGLEAAAVLTELGCTVTVAEMQSRLLSRVAGEALSAFYEAEHRARGVDVRLGCEITCIEGEEAVTGVRLDTDEVIPCEAVVVGIGIIPAVGPLIAAGAAGANGVDVDEFCRTSLPDIYAIGDCAAHANRYADGAVIRLESVQNAHDMAATAARSICGDPLPYEALPWFWSNQYDLRLQTAGLNLGHDTTVLRGNPAERSLSVLYLQSGRLIAVDAVNATKDYVQGRKLIEARATIDPEAALDAATPLASLL